MAVKKMNDSEMKELKIKLVLQFLKEYNETGLTVSQLSRNSGHTRATVAKCLEVLYERGKACYRLVGKAKVWNISKTKGTKKTKESVCPVCGTHMVTKNE